MTTSNAQDSVNPAARSILEQSHPDLELVIVDDGSTDATPRIVLDLERRDPRVRVILRTTRDGAQASRNTGLLATRGRYVAFQDARAWSHPDRISATVAVLEKHPHILALTTGGLSMRSDGAMIVGGDGEISTAGAEDLVFRRAAVLEKASLFDTAPAGAGYVSRGCLTLGQDAVVRLDWPLSIRQADSHSSTSSVALASQSRPFAAPDPALS